MPLFSSINFNIVIVGSLADALVKSDWREHAAGFACTNL